MELDLEEINFENKKAISILANNSVKKIAYYCINLKKDEDRRLKMIEKSKMYDFEIVFVDAISGLDLKENDLLVYQPSSVHRKLKNNEIACSLSHKKTLNIFLNSNYDYAVIFEDDAYFCKNVKKLAEEFVKKNVFFDVLRLEASKKGSITLDEIDDCKLMLYHKNMLGSSCIMYSRAGAEKTLRLNKIIRMPFDLQFLDAWKYDLKLAILNPSPVRQEVGVSSIGTIPPRFFWPKQDIVTCVIRFFWKSFHSIFKRMHMLYMYVKYRYKVMKNNKMQLS
jgi:glycosyl transferase family 25